MLLWSLEFGIWSLSPGLSASQKLRYGPVAHPCPCFPLRIGHTLANAYEPPQVFPAPDSVRFAFLFVLRLRSRSSEEDRAHCRTHHRPSKRGARIREERHPAQTTARHLTGPARQSPCRGALSRLAKGPLSAGRRRHNLRDFGWHRPRREESSALRRRPSPGH